MDPFLALEVSADVPETLRARSKPSGSCCAIDPAIVHHMDRNSARAPRCAYLRAQNNQIAGAHCVERLRIGRYAAFVVKMDYQFPGKENSKRTAERSTAG